MHLEIIFLAITCLYFCWDPSVGATNAQAIFSKSAYFRLSYLCYTAPTHRMWLYFPFFFLHFNSLAACLLNSIRALPHIFFTLGFMLLDRVWRHAPWHSERPIQGQSLCSGFVLEEAVESNNLDSGIMAIQSKGRLHYQDPTRGLISTRRYLISDHQASLYQHTVVYPL